MSYISFGLWMVPSLVFLTAFVLILKRARGAAANEFGWPRAAAPTKPLLEPTTPPRIASGEREVAADLPMVEDPLFENLEGLCRGFRVRELSLLASKRKGESGQRARILVDFEAGARVDYTVYFNLRESLSRILDHPVDIVLKGPDNPMCKPDRSRLVHVLYAALGG